MSDELAPTARIRRAHHLTAGLLVLACALGGCAKAAAGTAGAAGSALVVPQTPPLALTMAARGDVRSTVRVSGQVVATRTARLYFHNGGTVAAVAVSDGQAVASGAVLASLDTGSLPDQIASDRLSIERDRLTLQNLLAEPGVPTTLAAADAELLARQQATLTLEQGEVQLKAQELTLAEDEIIAPFSGIVNDVSVASGDSVNGFETVMVVSDPATEQFTATIGQTVAQSLRVGQRAVVTLNATSTSLPGTVGAIFIPDAAEIAQAEANGATVPLPSVTLAVQGVSARPPLGATFSAQITVAAVSNVVFVPTDAVRQFNGLTYVDVLRNGQIVEKPVQTGLVGDTTTAIVHGLAVGERVVLP